MVTAVKVVNKRSLYNGEMIDWQEVTIQSGVKVACIDGKLIETNMAARMHGISDSTYSFTALCNRSKEQIDMSSVHIPKRRN